MSTNSEADRQMRESLERQLDDYTRRNVSLVMANESLLAEIEQLRAALTKVVEADDAKKASNASGQHASPISHWSPLEEALDEARAAVRG